MDGQDVRATFRSLAQEVAMLLRTDGANFQPKQRYVALFDTERDARIVELPSFTLAEAVLAMHPLVGERYGTGESRRLGLQFAYEFVAALDDPTFDASRFESVWERFWTELQTAEWTFIGVANLTNFASEFKDISLGDGITIRARSSEYLLPILGTYGLDRLFDDWRSGSTGSHVLLVEHREPKTPKNLVLMISGHIMGKVHRTLLALRLANPGDVRVGQVFFARPVAFDLLSAGGTSSTGWSGWHPGAMYHLNQPDLSNLRAMVDRLARFNGAPVDARRRVAVALRWYSAIYGRETWRAEDRVLDAVTAIEALVGEPQETTFKVAFRTAAILASTDEERVSLFKEMKRFYQARSDIVHGNKLGQTALDVIQDTGPLESVTRRLIFAFLYLVESADHKPSEAFYRNQGLDVRLLHTEHRQALRSAAGLT